MLRLHSLLLVACCVPLMVFFMATETTTTQAAQHSLSLNGTSGYVSVPNSAGINVSGPITVEAWIKVNAITGQYQDIVCRQAWGQAGSGGGYEFAITSTGKVRLDLYQSYNTYTTVVGTTTVSTNTWLHVAGVFDGSQMRVYVNGVLDGSLSTMNGPASGTSALNIGKSTYTSYYFNGLIDEVRLSAAALYSTNFTPGLGPANNTRAHWKFDGQTANDSSGSNHGTLQGAATYSTDVPSTSNNAPNVNIVDPLHNTAFNSGSTIVIDATASDSDGTVQRVDFFQGTTLLGSDTSGPYSFSWPNVPAGTYSISAKATDDDGAITTTSAVSLNVIDPGGAFHSLSLNGTSGYVSVPNSAGINVSGPITVEAWIKVNAITGQYQDIVCRQAWGQVGSGGGYEFAITSTGKVRLDLYQSHNTYTTVVGTTTVSTNAWLHVAGVFDGSQMRVYVNGVLDGSLSTTNGPASGTSALNIGKSTYTSYYFNGLIDEVRLSAAALYSTNFTPGLGPANNTRGLWKFDGQTANDSSGNSNHGTLQGGAGYSTNVPVPGGGQRPVPVAGGPYNGQTGQAVQLSSNGSFNPGGTIAAYHWAFGDGTAANSANPSHTYAAPGLYTATLTVTGNTGLLASTTTVVTISSGADALLEPLNQVGGGGENPLSRNFNLSLPLVHLSGRAGMDLSLGLSYNSLVWTRNGSYISFDDDRGFPAPGFRLGFPVIQPLYFNPETGKYAFRLIGSDGSRKELRQVDTSILYEATDSSHLLLDASAMVLRTTDGTQLSYLWTGSEYSCTQIKDRNGNYITVNYTTFGRVDTIIDTLARVIKFNYDTNGRLISITQTWNQGSANQLTHNWATFTYADTTIQTNFPGLTVYGPSNNTTIKTLAKVTIADGSHSDFSYTTWGQVSKVSSYAADHHLLNYRSYNLPPTAATPQTDCPRFSERREWAQYWNGDTEGTPASNEEAVTLYAEPAPATWTMPDGTQQSGTRAEVTLPDGTSDKIYFAGTAGTTSGWRRGLPILAETYEGAALRRQAVTTWTQDNVTVSYPLNPRITETNVHDPSGNRARTQITYQQFTFTNGTSCRLPRDVYEYAANATTILRSTRTDYVTNASYTDRRILGLVSEKRLYEGDVNNSGVLMSKIGFFYDESGSIQGTDAPVQHDNTNYTASFITGRGNLTSVRRYDVTNTSQFTTTANKFNTAGAVVLARNAANHDLLISYADSFSDGNNSRGTLAYPTTITDPDGYSSTAKFSFDFGAVTSSRTPQPNVTTNTPGPERTFTFDSLGRIQQITNSANNAYTRFEYPNTKIRVDSYATLQDGQGEAHSFRITDGAGRVIATASEHPGSIGGYSAQRMVHDVLGRVIKTSNPAETNASGVPLQWTTAGDDAAAGWIYTEQTYDWKNRPLVSTNQDGTTKTASYVGCGCAGGEVVTVTDEGTIVGGEAKRRRQKIYHDIFGRPIKIEVLNWEDGGVYSATVNSYNARDQVTQIRQYAGPAGSSSYVDTILTFDGYGRQKTSQAAHQRPEPNNSASSDHTTFNYNADDSIASIVDARGVVKSFSYNNRGLVIGVQYDLSNIPSTYNNVLATGPATFTFDAAGNRISMADDTGSISYQYDSLSQLTAETRQFAGSISGSSFSLNYQYTIGGELKKVIDHTDTAINYSRDKVGRIVTVTAEGSLVEGIGTFASSLQYRAWGALKQINFGNGTSQTATFNSRLLPVASTLGNVNLSTNQNATFSWTYDYFADGRQRRSSDANDDRFDRAWEFDHVGRLKEAYSGREARGLAASSPTPDSPYRQTFHYDVFDQRTQKSGRFWRTAQTGNSPCTPRQANDGCDAEGNVLTHLGRVHMFDAAGKQRNFLNWQFTVGGSPNHLDLQPGVEITQNYDADGQVAKRIEVRRTEELVGGGPNTNIAETTTTTYYLYSSVLGGVKLVELNASGQKNTSYVYANGTRLARQNHTGSGVVEWHHPNPAGHSWVVTSSDRAPARQEMDPDGAEVGTEDPWASVIEPATYENLKDPEPLYIEGGDPFNFSGGHTIDGLPVTDAEYRRKMENGTAAVQLSANGRPLVTFTNQTHLTTISVTFDVFRAASQRSMSETSEHIGTLQVNFRLADRRTFFSHVQGKRTGFNIGRFGFNEKELQRLGRAYDKIIEEKCRKFFDDTLARMSKSGEIRSQYSTTPTTLAGILAITTLNRYSSNLTAKEVGISESRWSNIRNRFEEGADGKVAAGVTLGGDGRVFLGDNAFYRPGSLITQMIYKAGDLPGVIVHEFFHRAGLTEAQVKALNPDIQKNCGNPNDAL